jgi:glycosyltransferase involved in cell wall biosynthesis
VSLESKPVASESDGDERRPLKIAQVATLWESVPPKGYGGTERNVSYLTEELVRRGHQVTLFAAGDSVTNAKLFPGCERGLRFTNLATIGVAIHHRMLSQAYERASQFDIIHAHLDYWSFPFARLVGTPSLTTIHGRLDIPELHSIYLNYGDTPLVSISEAQRTQLPDLNWVATIYHGLDRDLLKFNPDGGKYLAFLGRISPEKGIEAAIEVSRKTGIPLKIAAKVDDFDREYYRTVVVPLLAQPGVEYMGEIDDSQKSGFLGNALAVLFPIDWPEPFGMVMIESLACGTPLIARPLGAVAEVLRDGVTGFIVPDIEGMVAAVEKIARLSRRRCREEFENRFTIDAVADQYEAIYRGEIARRKSHAAEQRAGLAASLDAAAPNSRGPKNGGVKTRAEDH